MVQMQTADQQGDVLLWPWSWTLGRKLTFWDLATEQGQWLRRVTDSTEAPENKSCKLSAYSSETGDRNEWCGLGGAHGELGISCCSYYSSSLLPNSLFPWEKSEICEMWATMLCINIRGLSHICGLLLLRLDNLTTSKETACLWGEEWPEENNEGRVSSEWREAKGL